LVQQRQLVIPQSKSQKAPLYFMVQQAVARHVSVNLLSDIKFKNVYQRKRLFNEKASRSNLFISICLIVRKAISVTCKYNKKSNTHKIMGKTY